MGQVGNNTREITCFVWFDLVFIQNPVQDPVQCRIMNMVYMWKKMMRDMVIKAPENKIHRLAERVEIIGAFYLVHEPGRGDIPVLIRFKISGRLYMVGHKKSKEQEQGLHGMHQ